MAHLLAYDSNGNIVASFDDEINPPSQIAEYTTIPVTDDQWVAWCNDQNGWTVQGGQLVAFVASAAQMLSDAQTAQTQVIAQACEAQLAKGFQSSALGTPHTYPLDMASQLNLKAAVMRMQMTDPLPPATINVMCADPNNVWLRRAHKPAEIIQAGVDGMTCIEAVLATKDALMAQVNAASTVAAIQAITWPSTITGV